MDEQARELYDFVDENKPELAIIWWKDACILGTDQYSKCDERIRLASGVSVGIIVKETEDLIALSMDIFDTGETPYRTIHVYPKSGIYKIRRKDINSIKE